MAEMVGTVVRGYNGQLHLEQTGVRFARKGFGAWAAFQQWGSEKVIPYESIVGVEFRTALFGGARMGYLQIVIQGGPELKNQAATGRSKRDLLEDENTIAWQRTGKNAEFEAARDLILSRIAPMPDAMKTCPDCAESVKEAAKVCRFCGYRFGEG